MKLVWDKTGERLFETGVDRGVVFPMGSNGSYEAGVAWNGLTAFNASPSGAEANPFYADNMKYLNIYSAEEFGFSIEAYTYPDEFGACDGSAEPVEGVCVTQQPRKAFGFSCRTLIGNDVDGQNHGYKLHLIYNAMASPSERGYASVNESPEAITLSWECTTTPVAVTGHKPTAHITIDSTKVDATKLAEFEELLYGSESEGASLPTPDEVIAFFKGN
jgi:hypothetical protein